MRRITFFVCMSVAAGAALLALGPAPAQAQCFKITDLGPIRSSGLGAPFGINNINQAVFTVDVGPDLTENTPLSTCPSMPTAWRPAATTCTIWPTLTPRTPTVKASFMTSMTQGSLWAPPRSTT